MYVRGLVAGAGGLSFKQSRDGKWHSSEGTDSAAESDECDAMASTSTGKTRARMVLVHELPRNRILLAAPPTRSACFLPLEAGPCPLVRWGAAPARRMPSGRAAWIGERDLAASVVKLKFVAFQQKTEF